MSFVSRFNPRTGAADLWAEFRKPNPYRWPILLASSLPFAAVLYIAFTDVTYKDPDSPQIVFIETFAPDRTDAEIIASNKANQEVKELREAAIAEAQERKREVYKSLGKGLGMDVDKIAADADAERAAQEAAEAERRAAMFGDGEAANESPDEGER